MLSTLLDPSLLLSANHSIICVTPLKAHMHWKSTKLAHHRQLTLPAGHGPFLCLPSALTQIALQRWLCLMAPTSACGQQLHCTMPLACKLAPVYSMILLYVRSTLHVTFDLKLGVSEKLPKRGKPSVRLRLVSCTHRILNGVYWQCTRTAGKPYSLGLPEKQSTC